jgi:hypothetical protein
MLLNYTMSIVFDTPALSGLINTTQLSVAIRDEIIAKFGTVLPKIRSDIDLIKCILVSIDRAIIVSHPEKIVIFNEIYGQIFSAVSADETKFVTHVAEYLLKQPDMNLSLVGRGIRAIFRCFKKA